MGSSGSYGASVSISVPTKQKEKNTEEVIEILRAKNLKKEVTIKDFDGEEYSDVQEEIEKLVTKLLTENPEVKLKLVYGWSRDDCGEIELNSDLETSLKELEDELSEDDNVFDISYIADCTEKDLKFLNLDVINLINIKKGQELVLQDMFYECICSVSESIYGDEPNESYDSTKIDNRLRKMLSFPGAIICLEGNGSCY